MQRWMRRFDAVGLIFLSLLEGALGFGLTGLVINGQFCLSDGVSAFETKVGMGFQLTMELQGTNIWRILVPNTVGKECFIRNCQRVLDGLGPLFMNGEKILAKG